MTSCHRRVSRDPFRRVLHAFVCVAAALANTPITQAAQTMSPVRIEVFTTTQRPIRVPDTDERPADDAPIDIQIVRIDGIAAVEARLSDGLAGDPEQARAEATRRIHALGDEAMAELQRAATGLAKMVHYGLDRVPAIVLDGEAVVLGVTDVNEALRRYRQWRAGRAP